MEVATEGGLLSTEEVVLVIKNKTENPNFELSNYTFESLEQKIGLLCEHCILRATIRILEEHAEKDVVKKEEFSFFVKLFPRYRRPAEFVEGLRAFEKEVFMYNLFDKYKNYGLNLIDFCTATCYLSEYNRCLIFDNLFLQGFQSLDKYKTLDYNSLLTVIKALAKLHACSIIYEEKKRKELGKEYRLIHDHERDFEETFYSKREGFINTKGINASIKCVVEMIDLFNHREKLISGQNFKLLANELCYKVYDLVRPSSIYRNVASHGDLWSTNILVKYNDYGEAMECKFVDFQCGRYVPPTHDLMSVIHLTTSRRLRKRHMYEFTGIYYATLEKLVKLQGYTLKNILPFVDFMKSCEEQKLFAIIQAATYLPLILMKEDALIEHFTRTDEDALLEDRTSLIAKNIAKDDCYKNRLEEAIKDLRDYCEYM